MIDVHKRLHKLASDTNVGGKGDAIVPVARELARDGRVLCFDEFQVTDIVDAMILRRLLEALVGYGVVIITTSKCALLVVATLICVVVRQTSCTRTASSANRSCRPSR